MNKTIKLEDGRIAALIAPDSEIQGLSVVSDRLLKRFVDSLDSVPFGTLQRHIITKLNKATDMKELHQMLKDEVEFQDVIAFLREEPKTVAVNEEAVTKPSYQMQA